MQSYSLKTGERQILQFVYLTEIKRNKINKRFRQDRCCQALKRLAQHCYCRMKLNYGRPNNLSQDFATTVEPLHTEPFYCHELCSVHGRQGCFSSAKDTLHTRARENCGRGGLGGDRLPCNELIMNTGATSALLEDRLHTSLAGRWAASWRCSGRPV